MQPLIIFTHIQKTAGTSFRKRVVEANLSPDVILAGSISSIARDLENSHRFVTGHIPYGIHLLTHRRTRYITFLRDPLDRAVSHYYFIRQCDPALCKHDRYPDATRYSLTEFYQQLRYQNEMTRMIAGIHWKRISKYVDVDILNRWMLWRAKRNLAKNYMCFGLQERFDESVRLIKHILDWPDEQPLKQRKKKTRKRPSVSELPPRTKDDLESSNHLDRRLYNFACELFDRRIATT